MASYILSLDQGTTSSRALLFDQDGNHLGTSQKEFTQYFPNNGWVEHDPEEIWTSTLEVMREVVSKAGIAAKDIKGIGITNQRETTIVWDRKTGRAIYNAIVWQDRRTASICSKLRSNYDEGTLRDKTGLLLDPYFSATKIAWILDNVDGARVLADQGDLAFGTIDSYLLWRLTDGEVHATDATNASRTNLFNIIDQQWDDELLALFDVPKSVLPEVKDCGADFGVCSEEWLGAPVPILAMIGDQQSALVGQACFDKGMLKSTYGTGCFVILNTGDTALRSDNKLLSTVAYRFNGEVVYALEGSIFVAGAAVQWLRDGLGVIENAHESEAIATEVGYQDALYVVPAFTGLGAPYWDPDARGAVLGLTRDTGANEVVTAGLESVAHQTNDLLEAMIRDGAHVESLRVDGGMIVNDWFAQCLSDLCNVPVERPEIVETTALGAAYIAAVQAGLYSCLNDVANKWKLEQRFEPNLDSSERDKYVSGWKMAVACVQSFKPTS
ncbi:glycerol kinase [Oleiphilus sp. HI0009]|nr:MULTISPECIES: glycerol kinase GlpK [unclassified Oleiphilus]KZX78010.1 glycerol kinase [Oleiphilus sp. HI0009]MCH2159331.1 glycerol kinase GlpK [Oleiphilaceae bacterium]KZY64567.1 glycerol kinase [Oleiphilus sp. HI0066]KZY68631.1 glycerol kinase [Oleiphilus sp. HI0067]KZZ57554.1 glycerol kinase [Oleiphilus sp. HI0125]